MADRKLKPVETAHRGAVTHLMTRADVMRALRVSRSTSYKMEESGELPELVIVHGHKRWRKADIEALIDTLEAPPAGFSQGVEDARSLNQLRKQVLQDLAAMPLGEVAKLLAQYEEQGEE